MSDRPAFELFYLMFPGDPGRQVPGAKDTGAAACLQKNFAQLDDMDTLLGADSLPDWAQDLNGFLKDLRGRAAELTDLFMTHAIMAYFSDPRVSRALTAKPTPLFPHYTALPDIDYDLLAPVLENCQRDVDV
ncbi:MAG: hypothetical protein ABF990_00170 [Acetobacter sp.]|uniref:hypothetical protein n=1 Tax=Acetobacter sp. TaxID=440 RepID=UPI0039E93799